MNLELFDSPTFQSFAKALTAIAVCSVAIGFLIILLNEARYGFLDATLFKPRAVLVGAVFLFLAALPISITQNLLVRKREEQEATIQRRARLSLSLVDYCSACVFTWFVGSYFFDIAPTSLFEGIGYVIGFLVICVNGLVALPNDIRAFWKAPRFWTIYSVGCLCGILVFACGVSRLPSFRYLIWIFITSSMFNAYYSDWRRGLFHSIKGLGLLAIFVLALSIYTAYFFPWIKASLGGGSKVPALLTIANAPSIETAPELSVEIVEATDSGYYVIPAGQTNVIFIPKGLVQLVEFLAPSDRRAYP